MPETAVMGLDILGGARARRLARFALASAAAILSACSGGPSAGGSCQSNRDCITGETCISGTCMVVTASGCQNDEQCPLGTYCDTELGECKMFGGGDPDAGTVVRDAGTSSTTPDAGTETPDAGALPDSGTGLCSVDTDCGTPPVNICQAGQCVLGCGQAGGLMCTGGTVCDEATGHCVTESTTCNVDGDCNPPTEICIDNACVFGCALDSSLCQTGEVCDTTTGRCVMVQTNCTDDSQCSPPMTVCESTQCVPGCDQAGGLQCSGATPFCDAATGRCTSANPNACNLDADCTNPDEICVANVCTLRCDAAGSAGCPAPQVCDTNTGRCLQGGLPLGDMTCTQDAQCAAGLCLGLTISMATVNSCSRPCGATSQCPIDFTCADINGMGFCLTENINTPPATYDTPSGGACNTTTNTCQSGWCNTGQSSCIETCSRAADCASFGGNCWTYEQTGTTTSWDNLCYDPGSGSATGAACTLNSNCRSGICNRYDSVCAAHCCSDSDCPTGQNCQTYDLDASTITKICVNKATTSGNLALGATCTAAADCDSEVCMPVDPTDMNSVRKCSTLCCQESDCNQLPQGGRCRAATGPITDTIVGVCIPN